MKYIKTFEFFKESIKIFSNPSNHEIDLTLDELQILLDEELFNISYDGKERDYFKLIDKYYHGIFYYLDDDQEEIEKWLDSYRMLKDLPSDIGIDIARNIRKYNI